VQIVEAFVDTASGYTSEREFLLALYQDLMTRRRLERERERSQRRRDISRGLRGFRIEEVTCPGCGKVFGRLRGACGRPKTHCSSRCKWRHTKSKFRETPTALRVGT
jgi:hypothetical protein